MGKSEEPPAYEADTNKAGSSTGEGNQSEGHPCNPDTRLLPEGFVDQYDHNYKRHFYVDTRANPPRSSWLHPSDESRHGYASPSGPPPGHQGYHQQGYHQQTYQQPMMQQPMMMQQQPMMMQQPMMGGGRMGGFGMGPMGAGLLGGGAGMLGGMALMSGMDNMQDHAYEDGYMQGQMNDGGDGGGGGDYGGGDFGGGDMGGGDF
ncbi:hypothetical protein MVES1_003085 [Malassezia vespertilionis]|uniref:WW domain-containing protein n=1 Tax=Malassezia vespertilionis TaxID=2020962 RepID=A0A2N1J9K6_9BASI|nr:uncharacterized protein MVES1_003085 [Malassezia vespertilionis]PKI83225.1 hypothetical protein MVES_002927 [Malassezia vespertilionis]WFD07715.1 hypothetical protein MVES1_003085 [Malassezia vespertilionis]